MDFQFRASLPLSVVILAAVLLAGCGGQKSSATTGDENTRKTEPVAKTVGKTTPEPVKSKKPAVALKPFDLPKTVVLKDVTPKELQAFITQQKGRVVLVDYWATWCDPCKKMLPHTISLGKKHAKMGLMVVSMCVDNLGNRERAATFLKSKDARLVNFYASETIDPDTLADEFEAGTLPLYRLYGADGKFLQALTPGDTETPQQFTPKLDAAVKAALGVK